MEADDKGVETCFLFSKELDAWFTVSSDEVASGVQFFVEQLRASTESGRIGIETVGFPETTVILRGDIEMTGTLTGVGFCCDEGGTAETTLANTTDLYTGHTKQYAAEIQG